MLTKRHLKGWSVGLEIINHQHVHSSPCQKISLKKKKTGGLKTSIIILDIRYYIMLHIIYRIKSEDGDYFL